MSEIVARFEFRAFGQTFGRVVENMRRLSPVERIRESDEVYVMSAGNNENNTKIRDETMDIKVLEATHRGLERWRPQMKGRFPMSADTLHAEVFPAFGVALPQMSRDQYSLKRFLKEIVAPHTDLVAVSVFKQRFGFTVQGVMAEWAKILVNGAALQTICLESADVAAIESARNTVGADDLENVNYLLAIKRVIGMEPLPTDFIPTLT